MVIDYSNQLLQ